MQDPRPAHDATWFNALAKLGLNPPDNKRHPVRVLDGMAALNQA